MSVQMLSFVSRDQFTREMGSCPKFAPTNSYLERSACSESHSDLTALSDLDPTALFLEFEHESLSQLSDLGGGHSSII